MNNRQTGTYTVGEFVDRRDIRVAPTGVSVVFATHATHNKRQDMPILLHPVLQGNDIKFLSTFRQEIGPCVLFKDPHDGNVTMDALYPPAASRLFNHCSNLGSATTYVQQRTNAEFPGGRAESSYLVCAIQ